MTGTIAYHNYVVDTTPPTILSASSDKIDGFYTTGEIIDIDLIFSEIVSSTGNITVTLDTGGTCSFVVTSATTGSCFYTVQPGDTSSDLTVTSVTGIIHDAALNAMVDFIPALNIATNKDIVVAVIPRTLYFN